MAKQSNNPKSSNWRIVIPNLEQYKDSKPEELQELKLLILERLKNRPQDRRSNIKSQFDRGLRYYHIAVERHTNGVPHLDILLIYEKSLQRQLVDFDFLLKHGHITTYRRLNSAIIDYGKKEDIDAVSNLPPNQLLPSGESVNQLIELQEFNKDPYRYLELKMLRDPNNFNIEEYVQENDLAHHVTNWSGIKNKLKDMQIAAANRTLKEKSGFKFISRSLIESILTLSELQIFDSWSGYQTIVDYLNQMILFKGDRDPKSLNLLISGPANCGKSALVWHPKPHDHFNPISGYCSVYPMGMAQWFPKYQSGVYHCIYWNQMKLTSYSYDTILKLLDGSPLDLPNKGGVSRKVDNPLIIMTSNMTLQEMIHQKFNYSKQYQAMAKENLPVRIQNVIVPKGLNLFLLQKLLVPA